MDGIAYQLTGFQFSAFRRLSRGVHALLGKMPTAADDEVLDAVENVQEALAECDRAIHEIERAGS